MIYSLSEYLFPDIQLDNMFLPMVSRKRSTLDMLLCMTPCHTRGAMQDGRALTTIVAIVCCVCVAFSMNAHSAPFLHVMLQLRHGRAPLQEELQMSRARSDTLARELVEEQDAHKLAKVRGCSLTQAA